MEKNYEYQIMELRFIEGKSYKEISSILNISKITNKDIINVKRKMRDEYNEIIRLKNNIYKPKERKYKKNGQFKFNSFLEFYKWWKAQDNKCYYCGTEQYKIAELVKAGLKNNLKGLISKRFGKRAMNLELERKDSTTNIYSKENCVLACYFCNNDKSDVISSDDYEKYFKDVLHARKKFIDDKYNLLLEDK